MLRPLVRPLVRALTRSPMESRGLRPTLSLDFTNGGVTDSRVTYSGGANGTRVNSAGLIVAATTPRFDYNPVTLAPLGLLVEEARTNILLRSAEFDNAVWTPSNVTITANTTTAPDGTLTADTFTPTAASGTVYVSYSAAAGQYTVSAYGKGSGSLALFNTTAGFAAGSSCAFNLATGVAAAITNYGATTGSTATIVDAGGGWYRCSLTVLATATTYFISLGCATSTANAIWGAQLEAGSFPTSYIPTTSASITRSADSAVMTGTNFSDWFNPAEGTFAPEFTYGGDLVTSTAMSANDNTSNNILEVAGTNSGGVGPYAEVRVGGVVQASMSDGNAIANTTYKTAFRYRANDFSFSHSGRSCVTDAAGTIPSVSQLAIGNRLASSSFNGWIRRLPYYRRGLSDAQLQALSA